MGKITTPKYRIEMSCVSFTNKRKEWHSYGFIGRPSDAAAKSFRDGMNASMQNGGTNEHLANLQSPYGTARIINQKSGDLVALFVPPAFEIV